MTKKEAIKTLRELWSETNDSWYKETYNMAIEALRERTKGHWETYKDEHRCSVCKGYATGEWYRKDDAYDYCPWCGSKMSEREEG